MVTFQKSVVQLLIHIFFWSLFYALWLYPAMLQLRVLPTDLVARLLTATVLFYINFFYLVPKLLMKKSISHYLLVSVLLIILITFAINISVSPTFPEAPHIRRPFGGKNLWYMRLFISMVVMAIPYTIGTLLRIYMEWKKNENLRKIVENEKVYSELQFLKTQLNPHFLFNSLNAIYALSVKKSPDTSQAIVNLSELMRYMLYEADKDVVPLAKELEYIKSYVQLQRLRLSDSENVTLNISGQEKDKTIPPLLFISFIENAFKYGTDYEGKTDVKINLFISNESIHITVVNKVGVYKEPSKNSGVGLKNVRNRLELLYPFAHELIVKNDEKTYSVDLTLRQ
ncbi:sensor histidine kinase [Spongiimicrobium sp. 3-5]|uniref:sensor histidine kinase n=1 Tax=Spongiimicrobium sp. 3-5 TaxID=3332596 RepID=UPI0039806DEA